MENFNENIPSNWNTTTSTAVSKESAQGRVHSGNYSVALKDKAKLYQDVSINGGCFYNFSFFAHGEGAIVSVEATVTFVNQNNVKTQGLKISVRAQDIIDSNRGFAYYRGITIAAPVDTVYARIEFNVTANGNQTLVIDDVSLSL